MKKHYVALALATFLISLAIVLVNGLPFVSLALALPAWPLVALGIRWQNIDELAQQEAEHG